MFTSSLKSIIICKECYYSVEKTVYWLGSPKVNAQQVLELLGPI